MMKLAMGDAYRIDLPVTTIASGVQVLPPPAGTPAPAQPAWERWNDYGIGLLLEGNAGSDKGELRQAEAAFTEVERLGRPEGPLNLARVYHKEGRLEDAVAALGRAKAAGAAPWTVAWLTGLVNKENGHLDDAIANFEAALSATSPELRARGFDFSRDYEVLNELGQALFERAKQERGDSARRRPLGAAATGRGRLRAHAGHRPGERDGALRPATAARRAGRPGPGGAAPRRPSALHPRRTVAQPRHRPAPRWPIPPPTTRRSRW